MDITNIQKWLDSINILLNYANTYNISSIKYSNHIQRDNVYYITFTVDYTISDNIKYPNEYSEIMEDIDINYFVDIIKFLLSVYLKNNNINTKDYLYVDCIKSDIKTYDNKSYRKEYVVRIYDSDISFLDLPEDIILVVIQNLSVYDIYNISSICKSIHKLIYKHEYLREKINTYTLYKNIYLREMMIKDNVIKHGDYDKIKRFARDTVDDIEGNKYHICINDIYFLYHKELDKICGNYLTSFWFDDIESKLHKSNNIDLSKMRKVNYICSNIISEYESDIKEIDRYNPNVYDKYNRVWYNLLSNRIELFELYIIMILIENIIVDKKICSPITMVIYGDHLYINKKHEDMANKIIFDFYINNYIKNIS